MWYSRRTVFRTAAVGIVKQCLEFPASNFQFLLLKFFFVFVRPHIRCMLRQLANWVYWRRVLHGRNFSTTTHQMEQAVLFQCRAAWSLWMLVSGADTGSAIIRPQSWAAYLLYRDCDYQWHLPSSAFAFIMVGRMTRISPLACAEEFHSEIQRAHTCCSTAMAYQYNNDNNGYL